MPGRASSARAPCPCAIGLCTDRRPLVQAQAPNRKDKGSGRQGFDQGFMVWGLWFGDEGLGIEVYDSGLRVKSSGFWVQS